MSCEEDLLFDLSICGITLRDESIFEADAL
jgi:hypothetical protein